MSVTVFVCYLVCIQTSEDMYVEHLRQEYKGIFHILFSCLAFLCCAYSEIIEIVLKLYLYHLYIGLTLLFW